MNETSDFEVSLAFVLRAEGGYVNDPSDPGGATNMGITQRTFNDWRRFNDKPVADVRELTISEAGEIYKASYWDEVTSGLSWPMNLVIFDAAVNHGIAAAHTINAAAGALGADAVIAVRRYIYLRLNNPRFMKGWMNRLDALRRLYL